MAPTPPSKQWLHEVEAQVVAGLVLMIVTGVGWLALTVPRQLDQILANQKVISERAAAVEARVGKAEEKLNVIDRRVTTLEAR